MGQITLRDLTSNEDIVVPPEGYIFGRVGGDADIQIDDNSISRRQARVSLKGGLWLLETLAVPQGAKASRPVQLQEGATFTVGQSEFEVVKIEAEEDEPAAPTLAPSKGKPGPPPAVAPGKKPNPPPSTAKTTPFAAQKSADAPGAPSQGIGALFAGVPRGIAYYLLNVPKLLVNPVGTVKKAIAEQPAEPMGKTELIGYALPSLVISLLLPSIATGLATLIGPGHVFTFSLFVPIGPAIGAVIGAVIAGYIFHPFSEWLITKLKGTSDARSRSNYFLQTMTLAIILAVPTAVGNILTAVPIPFINLLGPLLMVVGSMVTLYVTYQWLVLFGVVKWMLTVVKVLAVLALLGAGANFVKGLLATISGLGSSSSGATIALAEQKRGQATIEDAKEDEPEEKEEPVKAPKKDAPPKPEPRAEAPAVAAKEKEKEKEAPVAAKEAPPAAKEEPTISPSAGYATFAKRRDAIEKIFEADPTVLQKSSELQKLYADYAEDVYDLDKKWNKDTAKKPERAKLNAHLRDAELFGKSGKTIDALAAKLGIH